jgi:hypothetical protein
MTRPGEEHVTAWRSQASNEPPPAEREFELGCVYDLNIGIDVIDETVHWVRRGAYDELWVEDALDGGLWRAVRMVHGNEDPRGRRASRCSSGSCARGTGMRARRGCVRRG